MKKNQRFPTTHHLPSVIRDRGQIVLLTGILRSVTRHPQQVHTFDVNRNPTVLGWIPWMLAPLLYSLRRDNFYKVRLHPPYNEDDVEKTKHYLRYAYALCARCERLKRPGLLLSPYMDTYLASGDNKALNALCALWGVKTQTTSVLLSFGDESIQSSAVQLPAVQLPAVQLPAVQLESLF